MKKKEVTKRDEEKFLKLKIAENSIFDSELTFNKIINAVSNGNLSLEAAYDDGTNIIDDSSIEEIRKVIPCLQKIVDKPRSFIKNLEEKVPVETSKRINHKAIVKLSQDSNDWYARTLLSVKPKNIVSDTIEETLDLYENRFICSLILRISKLLAQARQFYKDQLKNFDDNSAINAINREYHYNTDSLKFYNKISKSMDSYHEDSDYRIKVENELEKIKIIEMKVSSLKRSDFYRMLSKKKKVVDPIQKTNILMFEYNYNQAFKLWRYLNQNKPNEKLDLDVKFEDGELEAYYMLYCFICVLSVLHDLNFKEISNKEFRFEKENRKFYFDSFIFKRDLYLIKVTLDQNNIKCSLNVNNNRQNDDFYFYPKFTNFESMSRSNIDDYTAEVLNSFLVTDEFSTTRGKYALVSINMNRCSEGNTFSNKVYRRFYSIGNNFSPDESKDNLRKWGNYKTGITIITPVQLRSNFLKIERIFNYHLLRRIELQKELTKCPLCNGNHIRNLSQTNYTCTDCFHNISINYCNYCDPKHKNPFIWIKYMNEKFLEKQEVVKGLPDMSTFDKLSYIEKIMGERATTSFELEKENSGWKLKTICPKCGIKLGDQVQTD